MEGPVSGRRFKRRTVRMIIAGAIAAVVLIGLVVGATILSQRYAEQARQEEQTRLKNTVADLAGQVAAPLGHAISQLTQIIRSQPLIDLFSAGDAAALAAEAAQVQSSIDSAIKVRLFLPGQYQLDRESKPPLGYASLDLLKQAEVYTTAIPAEIHGYGTDEAHLVLIRRVTDAENAVKGLVHLSMAVEPFINMDDINADGYVELVQMSGGRQLILGKSGNNKLRQGSPVSSDIEHSAWKINYWPSGGGAMGGEEGGGMLKYLLALLVIIGLACAVIIMRKRQQAEPAASTTDESGKPVVYGGAVRAIMDGEHPGLEKLVPGMTGMGQGAAVKPLSQGLSGDDVTAFATPDNLPVMEPTPVAAPKKPATPAAAKTAATATKPAAATEATTIPVEAIPPVIFRAYDIRGVVGKTLSAQSVRELGRAIGSEAKARNQFGMAVGRDGRTSSPELAESLIAGLRSSGCDVIDIGQVATPVLYFATYHLETGSGVMVTGSHNGPEYNGLKIMLDGETLSGEAIQSLRKRLESGDLASGQGSLQTVDITADYIRRATEDIPVALGGAFKLVIDCGNGVAGGIAPQLFRALGHDVVELYCDIDGSFPNHHPDPSQPDNLTALINKVKETGADLGLAFDGDGDRLGVVDNDGNIIWPDRQMMLFARDVLSRNAGETIIYDVKCSRYLKAIIEASGGKPLMWKTGHSLIKNKMKELNAPLAGEMSGHIFFKERWYGFDDAIYAGARLLEILTKTKSRPAEVFGDLPDGVSTPELRIPLPEKLHAQFMQALSKKMSFADAEVTTIDGIRVDFAAGWGLIRPSNTSPNLVVRFEAENAAALEQIEAQFRELIRAVTPDLKLPF